MKIILRSSVRKFAEAMELVLQKNDHKGGWGEMYIDTLFERLKTEVGELQRCFDKQYDNEGIAKESIDVANFAMMLWENNRTK